MLCLDDTAKKAAFVAAQWKQAKGAQPDVVCGCGLKLPPQYNAEKVGAGDTPETRGPWTDGYHWD